MKRVFRLLSVILNGIIGIAEERPSKNYMPFYEAQQKFDSGLISAFEYKEAFLKKSV
ncbi:hypothetical protein [Legionella septentrionalis]|uniref:hypothetical protein n=1 Tax=Legionella septentrionalis TaxID=2498109 RepID=UPI0018F533E2|nr:hypothetical protein [Legionella septentrionalis]